MLLYTETSRRTKLPQTITNDAEFEEGILD